MKLLIDASRNRSGGIISYLKNFVKNFDRKKTKIDEIIICSHKNLLGQLPYRNFVTIYNHNFLEKNLLYQLLWQFFILPKLLKKKKINILFSTDASTVCHFSKSITVNQDLLSFGKNINTENDFLKKLRLHLIKYLQIRALNKATVAIFSSIYSKKIILKYLYKKNNSFVIYPGVDNQILNKCKKKSYFCSHNLRKKKIKLIYVSPLIDYKNHLSVVKAYNILIKNYNNIEIKFVGNYLGNLKLYNKILNNNTSLSKKNFIGEISNAQVIKLLYKSDIFIFASSVEAFGMTVVEAMAVGIPIVCSNQSSLPEILKSGGLYFDPKNSSQLANQIDLLIKDYSLRKKLSRQARKLVAMYNWKNHMNKFYNILNKF
jgi:glycosyltransferase involved in cell wall biosynthesis